MEKLPPPAQECQGLQAFVENGIPIARLQLRLRPATGNMKENLEDYGSFDKLKEAQDEELKAHDNFSDFSKGGFLGKTESLLDVVSADLATVGKYDTTHAAIAQAIEAFLDTAPHLNPDYEYIPPNIMTMGDQSCPWECAASGQNAGTIVRRGISDTDRLEAELSQAPYSIDWLLDYTRERKNLSKTAAERLERERKQFLEIKENRQKPREVFYAPLTGLLPHLIQEHLFFEGHGSPYRADPEFLIKAFNLGKAG